MTKIALQMYLVSLQNMICDGNKIFHKIITEMYMRSKLFEFLLDVSLYNCF